MRPYTPFTIRACLAAALLAASPSPAAVIERPDPAPKCVDFGIEQIREALRPAGEPVSVVSAGETPDAASALRIRIRIGTADPRPAESYRIVRTGRRDFEILGSDAVGAMYGCFEVAEDIRRGTSPDIARRIRPRSGEPFLEIRGDNPFITLDEDGSISPWFYSEEYWTEYVRTLALNRYNLLDLHAMYQIVQTGFPNAYPYFIPNPKFPQVRAPNEDVEKNLAMLNRIVEIARDHGVHTALMNYNAQVDLLRRPRMDQAVLERIDPSIDFDWADGSPSAEIDADGFAVRWEGRLLVPSPGLYTIIAESDDGIRVWIDGTRVIDDWKQHPPQRFSAQVRLEGDSVPLRVDYFEAHGGAVARLLWLVPGASEPVVVPASALVHSTDDGTLAPGVHATFFNENYTPQLVEYTRTSAAEMIRRCPDLWMLGFRVGESGQPEDFYRRAYLPAFADAGRTIRLYTRTWLAKQEDLARIAAEFPGLFAVEIKYNGEHLGAPYHAIQDYGHSYSYQNYLDFPRDWEILWQIRANGTHRLFRWSDPQFMRRTVLSCRLGDAWGFSMEPITAYYSQDPADYYRRPEEVPFRWMFQRHWPWYLLWGRLAYDPDTPDTVFLDRFRERFGEETGEEAWKLLVTSSRIIPAVYQAHAPSADHRGMAPEFENGNNGKNVLSFARTRPLDRHAVLSPWDYAARRIAGEADGRITPPEIADRLDRAAEETLAAADALEANAGPELADWIIDARCLAWLGRYYAAKLRGAVEISFLEQSGDLSRIPAARKDLIRARAAWNRLAEIGDSRYRPLLDKLRMHTTNFTWTAEGEKLDEQDLGWLEARREALVETDGYAGGHVPPARVVPGKPLTLEAGLLLPDPGAEAVLCRRLDGEEPEEMPMTLSGVVARVSIEIPDADRNRELSYHIEARSGGQTRFRLPGSGEYRVPVSGDDAGPLLQDLLADPDPAAGVFRISTRAVDPSGIREVRLIHKILPTGKGRDWRTTPMTPVDRNGTVVYSAEVPLTPHGLLYTVEAIDGVGNATRRPDFRTDPAPYRIVPPFEPPSGTPPEDGKAAAAG